MSKAMKEMKNQLDNAKQYASQSTSVKKHVKDKKGLPLDPLTEKEIKSGKQKTLHATDIGQYIKIKDK